MTKKLVIALLILLVCQSVVAQKNSTNKKDTINLLDTLNLQNLENKVTKLTEKSDTKIPEELIPPPIWEFFSIGKVFWAVIFIFLGYILIRFIVTILERFAEKSTTHRITIKGLIPIVKIFGWILIMALIVAGIFRPPAATLIAVTASLGIAIGFAAQDILKNIFGGVMILLDRPFQVGDKIEVGSYYGEVVEIGLRSIRIVTPDDSLVSIPNGELMNQSVSNANNGEANCQVVAEIYLPITADTKRIRQVATEAAQVSKYVYLNKPIAVLFFNEVKEKRSYLKMRLKAYVLDIRYEFAFKSDMTEIVIKQLLEENLIDPENLK